MTAYFRDPHVVSLRYRIERSEGVTFGDDIGPIERELDAFRLSVTHETATAHMKEHYATERGAREVVERYLRPWEIYEAVRPMGTGVKFSFLEAEIVDRDPPPIYATARAAPTIGSHAWAEVVRELRFPDLPEAFAVSSAVEVMWTLYERYLKGRDRLLPMAYTCLTRFRYGSGGNKEAASRYHVSRNVLNKLGRLSSESGDETTARKWVSGRPPQPLSDREKEWVEDAVSTHLQSRAVCLQSRRRVAEDHNEALAGVVVSSNGLIDRSALKVFLERPFPWSCIKPEQWGS
jgi:hypothetical protein